MFDKSSQFMISHSQLAVNHINTGPSSGIDVLYNVAAHEAAFDSNARDPPPRCCPGTRNEYIDDFVSWALAPANANVSPLLLMTSPAGIGKSAIAQTCVERLRDMGIPLVAFFFGKTWNDHQKFFPTIAYQLSTEYPEYQDLLETKIRRDRSILYHKTMASQLKGLILDPFKELERVGKGIKKKIPIFIDALDQYDSVAAQTRIVELAAAAANCRTPTFFWAFFCRPEAHIEEVFSSPWVNSLCRTVTLYGLYSAEQSANRDITSSLHIPLFLHAPRHRSAGSGETPLEAPVKTITSRSLDSGDHYDNPSPMDIDGDKLIARFATPDRCCNSDSNCQR